MGALGEHESVAAAHKHGCAAFSLVGGGDAPQMKIRQGLDANKLIMAGIP